MIVRTFMREMMASATESECRTLPAFCGRLLRTAAPSHADPQGLLRIAHGSIQMVFSVSGCSCFVHRRRHPFCGRKIVPRKKTVRRRAE